MLFYFSDIYTPVIGQNEKADGLFVRLNNKISRELRYHRQVFQVLGALDAMISSSAINKSNEEIVT